MCRQCSTRSCSRAEISNLKGQPSRLWAEVGSVCEAQHRSGRSRPKVLVTKGSAANRRQLHLRHSGAGSRAPAEGSAGAQPVKEAGPPPPVLQVLGFRGRLPQAGDSFSVVADATAARENRAEEAPAGSTARRRTAAPA